MKIEGNDSWRRRRLALSCRPVIWIRWLCTIPWRWLEEMKQLKSGDTKTPSSPQSPQNKQASLEFSDYLLVAVRLNQCPHNTLIPASVTRTPLANFESVLILSLGSGSGSGWGSGSAASSKALCFRIAARLCSLSSWSLQHHSTNLSAWLNVAGPEAKRRKSRRLKSGDDCVCILFNFYVKMCCPGKSMRPLATHLPPVLRIVFHGLVVTSGTLPLRYLVHAAVQ